MSTPTLPPVPRSSLLAAAMLAVGLAVGSVDALAGDQGLRWKPQDLAQEGSPLPQWQGRFGLATRAPEDAPWTVGDSANRLLGASLMGDYYFSRSAFSRGGGFRATGGLLLGTRNPLWSGALGGTQLAPGLSAEHRDYNRYSLTGLPLDPDGNDSAALPYVGIGYTGLFGKRPLTGVGWGFSADLGMMSLSPASAVRLGNVLGGQQSAGDLVRDLQLNPMLHLGVSYAF
ncbi:hypothetical protein [Rivibacter subsaxonicus]|uniref:Outer membrane protein n=1 Tax=Rivibacter subsaxonicus TaxID=457575 RepID=A0A4Q7VG78_9BURK|nr:hypothetical protein [Rivibacter subsaxonicus]RZT95022.1 hypothetical protein EV670_2769 [Rivibacter subsaxonicus]